MPSLHDFTLTAIDGTPLPLADFRGKAVLLVNVASRCGLTPQYAELEALWREAKDMGLVVLGVPCNQFGAQEPGSAEEIRAFCSSRYDVTFPLAAKIEVNGAGQHPLYAWLTKPGAAFPGPIRWNFEKFLIGRDGRVLARFEPTVRPQDGALKAAIAEALAAD
jgi:glutathione peroxidase